MDPTLQPLAALLALNTDLLLNSLEGLGEDDGRWRPGGTANHVAFLTAHLVDARHFMARLVGRDLANPLSTLLAGARRLEDIPDFPALVELSEAWRAIAAHLDRILPALETGELAQVTPQKFPGSDGTLLGAIGFLVQHESYHIGQIAMLRRMRGFPAMSYARRRSA
jgi:uncharacterized damage-inducible protein DinB